MHPNSSDELKKTAWALLFLVNTVPRPWKISSLFYSIFKELRNISPSLPTSIIKNSPPFVNIFKNPGITGIK